MSVAPSPYRDAKQAWLRVVARRALDARLARDLSRAQASEASGVSMGTIQNIESGDHEVGISAVAQLCTVYDIDPVWLLAFDTPVLDDMVDYGGRKQRDVHERLDAYRRDYARRRAREAAHGAGIPSHARSALDRSDAVALADLAAKLE